MKTLVIALMAASLLAHPAIAEDSQALPLTLSVIKTPEPPMIKMENNIHIAFAMVGAWVPLLINKGRNSGMSDRLNIALKRHDLNLADKLSAAVSAEVAASGFRVTDAPPVRINPEKPWVIKYNEIQHEGDALLYMYFENTGVQSTRSSPVYLPFSGVTYCVVTPASKGQCAYGDTAYYGHGYEEEEPLVFPASYKYQWRDEEDVLRNHKEVAESLDIAIGKLAGGIAKAVIGHLEEEKAKRPAAPAN